MLSLSADASNTDIDLQLINGDTNVSDGIPHSTLLMQFAEAVAGRDPDTIAKSRQALYDAAGKEVVIDAAAVAGNFQRMVRIADATGIPVDAHMEALSGSIQEDLDLRRFPSAQNSPRPSALARLVNRSKGALMRRLVMLTGRR